MDSGFAGEGLFFLVALLPFLIYLALVVFLIYFAVRMIKFMNQKTKLDQEKNRHLAELVRVLEDEKVNKLNEED